MTSLLKRFSKDEAGAVTVDFVVVTAAIIGLGVLAIGTIAQQVKPNAQNLENRLVGISVIHQW